ncbi:MAG: TetR/AcrR family transcriptional regulator [Spirochaetota bacterium]
MKSSNNENKDRRKNKRELIIESAITGYSKYGISGIKVKDIADIAGIGKSTIYEYFDSKEDIEKAAINKFMFDTISSEEYLYQSIEQDPISALNSMMDNMISFPLENPEIYNFYMQILMKNAQEAKNILKKDFEYLFKYALEPIKYILKKGIEQELIKDDINIDNFALMIGIILDGMGFFSLVFEDKSMITNIAREAKDLVLRRLVKDEYKLNIKDNEEDFK